jgi:hypothetical protein
VGDRIVDPLRYALKLGHNRPQYLVPRKTRAECWSFTPLTMLQASAQAVDFKVRRHFGEGQGLNLEPAERGLVSPS